MPVCLAMGEAAGLAAALAARMPRPDVHAVDTARLRRRLAEEGAWLPSHEEKTGAGIPMPRVPQPEPNDAHALVATHS